LPGCTACPIGTFAPSCQSGRDKIDPLSWEAGHFLRSYLIFTISRKTPFISIASGWEKERSYEVLRQSIERLYFSSVSAKLEFCKFRPIYLEKVRIRIIRKKGWRSGTPIPLQLAS
jgi:hypothetical protein